MAKRRATKEEREHLTWIRSQPCIRCKELGREQTTPTSGHHVRKESAYKDHSKVVPLCRRTPQYPVGTDCHRDVERSRSKFREDEARWLKKIRGDSDG